jgi:Tfp pilus assembly protein PilZ
MTDSEKAETAVGDSTETHGRKSAAIKAAWADPEARARRIEAIRRARQSLESRQRTSAASKASWADPEERERRTDGIRRSNDDPEVQKRKSEASEKAWADPEKRQRMTEAISEAKRTDEARARASESIRAALVADPGASERLSAASKQSWSDPEVRRARTKGIRRSYQDPDVRLAHAEGISKSWTPERKKKQSERSEKMWAERKETLRKAGLLSPLPKARGGRPAEDEIAIRIQELKAAKVSWPDVKRLLDEETGVTRTMTAYRNSLSRYLKRQESSPTS